VLTITPIKSLSLAEHANLLAKHATGFQMLAHVLPDPHQGSSRSPVCLSGFGFYGNNLQDWLEHGITDEPPLTWQLQLT